eukprot:1370858-Amorphochlora_amoeboformis.AAC.1
MVDETPTWKGWGTVIVTCVLVWGVRGAQYKVDDHRCCRSKNGEQLGLGKGYLRAARGQNRTCGGVETPRVMEGARIFTLNLIVNVVSLIGKKLVTI